MKSTTAKGGIKPYFLRAFYEWCCDQALTPYVTVFINDQVKLPRQYTSDETITLNISQSACSGLLIDNHWLSATMRFAGVSHAVLIPMHNILSIFARETGQAMAFEKEAESMAPSTPQPVLKSVQGGLTDPISEPNCGKPPTKPTNQGKSILHIVKRPD